MIFTNYQDCLRARDWSGILGDNGEAHSFDIFAKIQAESPAGFARETRGAPNRDSKVQQRVVLFYFRAYK